MQMPRAWLALATQRAGWAHAGLCHTSSIVLYSPRRTVETGMSCELAASSGTMDLLLAFVAVEDITRINNFVE